jgi:uncharacterized protein (DUF1499 family)
MRSFIFVLLSSFFLFIGSFLCDTNSAIALTEMGQLSPCPKTPNCVISQGEDSKHGIAPLGYSGDLNTAKEALVKVLSVVPRTVVVEETDNYIRAESTSRVFHFVDDVEFYFPSDEQVIHVRSASRVGESDLGVNRRRIEQIRLALKDLNI